MLHERDCIQILLLLYMKRNRSRIFYKLYAYSLLVYRVYKKILMNIRSFASHNMYNCTLYICITILYAIYHLYFKWIFNIVKCIMFKQLWQFFSWARIEPGGWISTTSEINAFNLIPYEMPVVSVPNHISTVVSATQQLTAKTRNRDLNISMHLRLKKWWYVHVKIRTRIIMRIIRSRYVDTHTHTCT